MRGRAAPAPEGAGAVGRTESSPGGPAMSGPDDERRVDLSDFDDGPPVLPDITDDERGSSWGEYEEDDVARLLEDRPPHWG